MTIVATRPTAPAGWPAPDRWVPSGAPVDSTVVGRVHAAVGDRLATRHTADEDSSTGRLSVEDERALSRKFVADELATLASEAYAHGRTPLSECEEEALAAAVFDRLHGLAGIEPLLRDPEVRDIHISGHDRVWLALRDGRKLRGPPVAASDDDLVELVSSSARRVGRSERRWDHAHPELNLHLANGDRLHGLLGVTGRPTVTIRRHDFSIHRLARLVDLGVIDEALVQFLGAAVRAKLNLIVGGGTGTGKTTALRCLINEIPSDERLITVEDSLEIGVDRFENLHPDAAILEARDANTEGVGAFTMAELVRAGLRMDPDRVIVGEVRGAEVLPMLLAMSQGNDGSMCSVHADSSKSVFGRLAMYAAMTRERLEPEVTHLLVANAVDLVVHLGWVGGVRRVTSVREVTGVVESGQVATNELWRPGADGWAVPAAPPSTRTMDRLAANGFDLGLLGRAGGWWSE